MGRVLVLVAALVAGGCIHSGTTAADRWQCAQEVAALRQGEGTSVAVGHGASAGGGGQLPENQLMYLCLKARAAEKESER